VDKEAGTITGYELQATENPGRTLSEGAPVASSVELWSVVFPKESEEIAAVVGRRADEKVHSQVSRKYKLTIKVEHFVSFSFFCRR
jgi:hypothetical protein